jgi:hypothetical protein
MLIRLPITGGRGITLLTAGSSKHPPNAVEQQAVANPLLGTSDAS